MKKLLFFISVIVVFASCDQLLKVAGDVAKEYNNGGSSQLTKQQVTEGLKTALQAGTENAVGVLHQQNGYFADQTVKIMLPSDAYNLLKKAKNNKMAKTLGVSSKIQQLESDVVLRLNRAAEDAAIEAKPIFINAISNLNLSQAWDILKGRNPLHHSGSQSVMVFDSAAATHYLKDATFNQLKASFKPKIDASLNKKLVGNISTNEAWTKIITLYNQVAPYIGGKKLNPSLSDYATTKALDGLFLKVSEVEKDIRRNPGVWAKKLAKSILDKVFGKH